MSIGMTITVSIRMSIGLHIDDLLNLSVFSRFDAGQSGRLGYHLLQQLEPLSPLLQPKIDGSPSDIAARPSQTLREAGLDDIPAATVTVGIVVVAALESRVRFEPKAIITSGLRRTTSRARSGKCAARPSPEYRSIKIFFTSTYAKRLSSVKIAP